ncbi:MAG: hypothetical protein ABI884_14070 [Gemmatimonadota bacterium]
MSMLISCGSNPDTAPLSVANIVISAPSGTVITGGSLQLTATATNGNGDPVVITPAWSVVGGRRDYQS